MGVMMKSLGSRFRGSDAEEWPDMKRSLSYCAILFAAWGIATPFAHAQPYPNKIVRILTTEAGSGGDLMARLTGQVAAKAA